MKEQYHYQAKDFEKLKDYTQHSIVFAIFKGENGKLQERPIYKTIESAASDEVYLYLGDDRKEKTMNSSEKKVKEAFLEKIEKAVKNMPDVILGDNSVGIIQPLNVLVQSFLSFTQALSTEASIKIDEKKLERR